jgi:hypothetical protein
VLALLALASCGSEKGCVERETHSEERKTLGALVFLEATTNQELAGPEARYITTVERTLLGPDGRVLRSGLYHAAVDPQKSRVVATGEHEARAWLYDATTGAPLGERALPGGTAFAEWSPDGTALGVSLLLDPAYYVIDVPFTADTRLVEPERRCAEYRWSPSGTSVAYECSTGGNKTRTGLASAELRVWDRASGTRSVADTRSFIGPVELFAYPVWVGAGAHLCSKYFVDRDPACPETTGGT